MAEEEMKDTSSPTAADSSEDESDSEQVELLVTGRERRKTAGNRYNQDMVLEEVGDEEEPDEVALLFAGSPEEEDEEFKSDASDEDEMSSSDDDDQGPNAGGDEMEGEKELDKQRKQERAKKRKAEMALTSKAAIRKRPRIDPTQTLLKKPSKKKERVTWLPEQDTATGRSSLRKQTIAHREETLARLKESEAQSKKLKALKEKRDRDRAKAKDAPKAMTQADRLAEAEKIERRNAKSLNRWEATEKKRIEEQAAKLAALKERKLEGPVITWWSGKAKWRGPRMTHLSKVAISPTDTLTEPKKRGRKPKAYHEQLAAALLGESAPLGSSVGGSPVQQSPVEYPTPNERQEHSQPIPASQIAPPEPQEPNVTGTPNTSAATPDSATANALNQGQDQQMSDAPAPSSMIEQPIHQAPAAQEAATSQPTLSNTQRQEPNTIRLNLVNHPPHLTIQPPPPPPQSAPQVQLIEEITTKNLVILDKFNELSDQHRQDFGLFYNSRKTPKPVQHRPEMCPITMQVARYKDPATGIGYANMMAYKVLQELKQHKFTWSSMLGCYAGRVGAAVARGVPDGYPDK